MAWEGYRHPCPEGENCPSYSITRDFGKGGTDIDFMRQKGDTMWFIEEKHITTNGMGSIPFYWKDIPPAGRLEILDDPQLIAWTSNIGYSPSMPFDGGLVPTPDWVKQKTLSEGEPLPDDYKEDSDKYALTTWPDGKRTLYTFDKDKILDAWKKWCDKEPDRASIELLNARLISTGQLTALCNLAVALGERHYVYVTFYNKESIRRPKDMSEEMYKACKEDMVKHMFWVYRLNPSEDSLYNHYPLKKYYPESSNKVRSMRDFTWLPPSFTFESIEDYQKWRDNLGMDE